MGVYITNQNSLPPYLFNIFQNHHSPFPLLLRSIDSPSPRNCSFGSFYIGLIIFDHPSRPPFPRALRCLHLFLWPEILAMIAWEGEFQNE